MGQFALSEQALKRVVQWMLLHAGQANPDPELQVWRRSGALGHPGFSFGMYQQPGNGGRTTLELRDLRAWAGRIDAAAGGALLTRELAAADGITGFQTRHDASVRFAYGLTLVLGEGNQTLDSIRPGGATSLEHLPTMAARPGVAAAAAPVPAAAAKAEPVPAQAPPAAVAETKTPAPPQVPPPAPVQEQPRPARRPSTLNWKAPEFFMPEG
jgi:hypothetical protein